MEFFVWGIFGFVVNTKKPPKQQPKKQTKNLSRFFLVFENRGFYAQTLEVELPTMSNSQE